MTDDRTYENALRTAKPRDKAYDLALGRGLSALIAVNGKDKTFYWRGQIGDTVTRVRLGSYGKGKSGMSLNDARAAALIVKDRVKNGEDPRLTTRRAARGTDTPYTIDDAAKRYKAEHLDTNKVGDRWGAEAWRILETDALPTIGSYALAKMARSDLSSLVASKTAAARAAGLVGIGANRLAAVLGGFFNFCVGMGWIDASPATRLTKAAGVREVPRDRVLSAAELGAVWNALSDGAVGHGVYSQILALLTLTGCRVSEIASLRVENVDLEAGSITIVKGKTKDAARVLPLGPTGRAMLVGLVENAGTTGRLFSAPEGGAIYVGAISDLARTLCDRLGQEPRWTPHDLRRTLVTELHESPGISEGVIHRIAGHTAKGVHSAVYDRSKRLESIRNALIGYENYVLACAASAGKLSESNVVKLRTAAKG